MVALGVLQFSNQYGHSRLEKACAEAILRKSCTYRTIKNILLKMESKS